MADLFDALSEALHEDRLIAVATVLGGTAPAGAKMLVYPDGQRAGTLGSARLDDAVGRDAVRAQYRQESIRRAYAVGDIAYPEAGDGADVFIEVMAPSPHLILFGGDHIAIPLTHFAKELGFRVTVADARSRFANRERFPDADDIIIAWPQKALEQLRVDSTCYIAILSHDPKLDEPATRGALRTSARYIGAIGSRTTHADRRERLKREGFSDLEIARIHGPIGLDLGGHTPAEIALAIMAEVVATAHGRELRPIASAPSGGIGTGPLVDVEVSGD